MNKRIFITGATSGIGKEAAIKLAQQGADVIIHGRDEAKAERVRAEISADSASGKVDVLLGDLSNKTDILALVDAFKARYDSLDVLINNAGGVMNREKEETAGGWEKTIAVNVLAPYMLSVLLFPYLVRQKGARIINTASTAHRMAKPNLDDFMYEERYNALTAYGDAKLYSILLGREYLLRQPKNGDHRVVMNAFHPGVVATNFAMESNSIYNFFFRLARPFLTSPEKGAETMVYLATQTEQELVNGKYFYQRKPAKMRISGDEESLAKELWEKCAAYTGINFGNL